MAEQRFNPEHIIELAEELRLAGFDIGTQQHIAAQDLLIALAAHNRLPADPREWRSLLAPIFCASPVEQEEFYGRFDLWLKRHPEWTPKPDDLHEPTRREIAIPAAAIHWLRKPAGIVSAALLILLLGFAVFLSLKTNRTLTGQVFSSDGDNLNPLPEAQVEFFNQPAAKTDRDGKFTINYQARNWNRIFNRQVADLTVTHGEHDPLPPIKLDVHNPTHQTIKLQKRQPKIPDQSTITLPPTPEATPPPIPLLPEFTAAKPDVSGTPNPIRWYHWLLIASPLLLFAAWLMLRWRRRRALLQKLQAVGSPNLRRLTVRGASEHLFQSQIFRRAVQDLRRHRRVEVRELDIPATVSATIRRGGMFQPLYGARKALPEYLLLIDRASPSDEQARFADELSQRLEAGGVFVDRFYFQNDPRTCRQREASSPMVTLLDLAARYPDHQLLIFSDGAGFISPLTGEPEHWLTSLSHWPRRVLLTPELDEQTGYPELALAEHDFLVLPANDDGFLALTEAVNAGELPNPKSKPGAGTNASSFPRLILERPKRWLERHEPRPAVLKELCDQLRAFLGEDGWYWLAACAVYPALSWDVTLYLGYKLFADRISNPTVSEGLSFEDRLLSLVRLPWFRYGSMPDWLRLRLIESFTQEQEAAVRRTIETMLLSALEHPQEGIPLELAEPTEANWWPRLKAKWEARWRNKRIAGLIEREPEDSPLKDFVFLGFLSGSRTRRLTVKLPELLNRVLFPQGQAVLGFRPVTVAALAILLSASGAAYVVNRSQQVTNTPPPPSQFYLQWDQAEQSRFIVEKTQQVLSALANNADTPLKEEDFELIRQKVSEYASRVGNGSTYDKFTSPIQNAFQEDLRYVFGRGVKYAPEISAGVAPTTQRKLPVLYLAMLETEFRRCPDTRSDQQGMFLVPSSRPGSVTNRRLGLVNVAEPCNVPVVAAQVASSLWSRVMGYRFSTNSAIQSIAIFGEPSGSIYFSLNIMNGYVWSLVAEQGNPLDEERAKRANYVYRFLAATIVGENPRSFGLEMNPLSSYAKLPAGSVQQEPPGAATAQTGSPRTPRARPTQGTTSQQPTAANCRNDIAESERYVIRTVTVVFGAGSRYDLGDGYVGNIYSPTKLNEINRRVVDQGLPIRYDTRGKPFNTCVQVVATNDCMNDIGSPKCLNVILTEAIPQQPALVIVPDVRAMTLADARRAIESARLRVGSITNTVNPTRLTINGVLRQQPSPGTRVRTGSSVNLEITTAATPTPTPATSSITDREIISLLGSLRDQSSLNRYNRKQSAYALWLRSRKDRASIRTAIAELTPFLKDNDSEVRAWIALALAESGETSNDIRQVLVEASKSDDERIRDNAVKALSGMRQQGR
ncbi:MAG: PASTA domain-containing protein [Acidobacteria bacterium]|nr:PASTA domain-containing protein [Acidobacteriota bacterium]